MAARGVCNGVVSYGVCIPSFSCRYVLLVPRKHQCEFVNRTADCGDEDAHVRYTLYIFCSFNQYELFIYLGLFALLFNLCISLLTLSNLSEFLIPNVCFVSRWLGVSESLVGGVFLGLCHAAPDFLLSYSEARKGRVGLVLVYVLGKGLFITTFVMALVLATMRFRVFHGRFLRHMVALAAATFLILYSSSEEPMFVWEPVAYFVLSFLYVICVLSTDWWFKKDDKMVAIIADIVKRENDSRVQFIRSGEDDIPSSYQRRSRRLSSIVKPVLLKRVDREMIQRPTIWESDSFFESNEYWRFPVFAATSHEARVLQNNTTLLHRQLRTPLTEEERRVLYALELHFPTPGIPRARKIARKSAVNCTLDLQRRRVLKIMDLEAKTKWTLDHRDVVAVEIGRTRVIDSKFGVWEDFCEHMVPIDEIEWSEATCCSRLATVLEAPFFYVCKLMIPCVDESVLLNNWCLLLNCIHCLTAPLVCLLAFKVLNFPLDKMIPILVCTLGAGVVLAVTVLVTSYTNMAPRYHVAFAVLGIVSSLCLMYLLIRESINILITFANLFNVRRSVMFGTFLVWAFTLSQVLNVVALTKAGFPRVALNTLLSGGVFSMLVGMGIAGLAMIILHNDDLRYHYARVNRGFVVNELFYMIISVVATLIIVPTFAFECRSSHGWLLLVIYAMYLSVVFLSEYGVIHPLGRRN